MNTQREEKLELVNPGATTARVCLSSGEAEASASEATGAEISFDVERLEIAPGMKGEDDFKRYAVFEGGMYSCGGV